MSLAANSLQVIEVSHEYNLLPEKKRVLYTVGLLYIYIQHSLSTSEMTVLHTVIY
jgi:hypothetical protein